VRRGQKYTATKKKKRPGDLGSIAPANLERVRTPTCAEPEEKPTLGKGENRQKIRKIHNEERR